MKNRTVLQKVSFYSSILSLISAVICLVYLYLRVDDFGFENPISASLMASSFFFVSVGLVLMVMAKTNLPNFKIDKNNSD